MVFATTTKKKNFAKPKNKSCKLFKKLNCCDFIRFGLKKKTKNKINDDDFIV